MLLQPGAAIVVKRHGTSRERQRQAKEEKETQV